MDPSLTTLLQEVTRDPASLPAWEELARVAARVEYRDLELAPALLEVLAGHVAAHPEGPGLARLLLAARGLEVAPGGERPATAREGPEYAYDAATGLPLRARRRRDGALVRLVVPGEEPAFYLDEAPVAAGAFRGFLEEAGRAAPEPWAEVELPGEAPATCVPLGLARAYASWVGGALPREAQWLQAFYPEVAPLRPGAPDPTDLRTACPGSRFRPEDELRELVEAQGGAASDAPLPVHEWTASVFEWTPAGSDAEYFEKLESREGEGVVVAGSCWRCAAKAADSAAYRRYGGCHDEPRGTLGFRVLVGVGRASRDPYPAASRALSEARKERRAEVERANREFEEDSARRYAARAAQRAQEEEEALPEFLRGVPAPVLMLALILVAALLLVLALKWEQWRR